MFYNSVVKHMCFFTSIYLEIPKYVIIFRNNRELMEY